MKLRSISIAASIAAAGLCAGGAASAQTKTFTSTADFNAGTINNVATTTPNQVILGPTPVSKTNLVWATNYRYGWVVRLDAATGKQTARFDSALVSINGQPTGARPQKEYCDFATTGNCPGRVAVDTNGDVWIINRSFSKQGTLSKFSGDVSHCIDRNNNGVIDTSSDKNNDGIVNPDDPAEYLGQNDECILTTIPVGVVDGLPRGVAVDRNGKIWAATHNEGKVYRYNPNEPVTLETSITVGGNPYSLATGGDWLFVSRSGQPPVRVHITTGQVQAVNCASSTYGVVGDPGGNIAWFGGYFTNGGVWKVDFSTGTCQQFMNGTSVTAVTLDLQGFIWTANYLINSGGTTGTTVSKLNPNGSVVGTYAAGGNNPHGLSVDFSGNIWAILHGPGAAKVAKINQATGAIISTPTIAGPGAYDYDPYIYSDFTGVQINRQAPYTKVGSWEGVHDGGVPGVAWSKVTWNTEAQGAVPALTTLTMSVRAADTQAELLTTAYTTVNNGAALANIKGRYVQVRADLKGPGYATAVLSDVTVYGPCNVVGEACCISNSDCNDGNTCTQDTCPTPGGACQHPKVPNCCLDNNDCNDQNACTIDTCPAPGGTCQFAPKPDCCSSNADCNDGDLCTADICSGPGGTCSHPPINGCCNTDLDCTNGNKCSNATCPVPGGFCQGGQIPGCCNTDADCADNDLCTQDVCNQQTSTCENTKVNGCCNVDGECNDNNDCTKDACSGKGGTCNFSKIPGCCAPNDPMVGQPCDPPVSPYDKPPCKAGQWQCQNGTFVCNGAIKPQLETCNLVDDNCDGIVDSPPPCPEGSTCFNGICAKPCGPGEFGCPPDEQCVEGYCVPKSCDKVVCPEGEVCVGGVCQSADGGMTTSSSSSGSGGGGTGTGGAGGSSTTTTTTTGGNTTTTGSGKPSGEVSESGPCACEVPGARGSLPRDGVALLGFAAILGLGRRFGRRRQSSGGAAGFGGER